MVLITGIPMRASRNGAQAAKWVRSQNYNVDAAAGDPNTPVGVMLDIANFATGRLISILASNKGINEDVVRAIYANFCTEATLVRLASNPATPSDILYACGFSEQGSARSKALAHPNAPLELVIKNLPGKFLNEKDWAKARKTWRGLTRTYNFTENWVAMRKPVLPIKDFTESFQYISENNQLKKLYKHRGKEMVAYINSTYNLNLDYNDHYSVARAIRKYLP